MLNPTHRVMVYNRDSEHFCLLLKQTHAPIELISNNRMISAFLCQLDDETVTRLKLSFTYINFDPV